MKPSPQIARGELITRLAMKDAPVVVDVLPEEEFNTVHLPGAKNACVYNVTFLDDVKKLVADRGKGIVVYGSSSRNRASATAAEKLIAAGYSAVVDYREGLEDWRAAGQVVEGDAGATRREPNLRDGTHLIDIKKSKIDWTGRNLMGAHTGTIYLREGCIEVEGGHPVRGSFVVDMNTMTNSDIEENDMRQMLIAHLKSDDFFDTEHFPDAQFRLSKITVLPEAKPGSPNCEVCGDLTMKGVSGDLAFRAILGQTAEGLLAADAHFDIDRTRWNVLYGSGKFYEKLGKHLVHDEISLALKLVTLRLQ
jgi:polyisoprenoid-binding protein YceI/rhodanese-related sulfurtransferase